MARRHVRPLRRINPSGKEVWVARVSLGGGKMKVVGTRPLKREAQELIDAFYEQQATTVPTGATTVAGYFEGWLERHPRAERTEVSYSQRVRYVLDVKLGAEKRRFRDWPLVDVKRGHALELVDHMLRVQGRAVGGVRGVLRILCVMWEDAFDDGHEVSNPFLRVKVRQNDRRCTRPSRAPRVWTWEQMHDLCAAAALPVAHDPELVAPQVRAAMVERWRLMDEWRSVYAEPMLRVLSDCGLRVGEMFPLERRDVKLGDGLCGEQGCRMAGPHLHVRRSAWRGRVMDGTKTDHGAPDAGRTAPLGVSVASMLRGLPSRLDTRLLFPTARGRLFMDRNFYRDVWGPARVRVGVDATPHEFRHSYVSLMRAAGVDPADLASWTGHTVLTATTRYTHSTGASVGTAREALG